MHWRATCGLDLGTPRLEMSESPLSEVAPMSAGFPEARPGVWNELEGVGAWATPSPSSLSLPNAAARLAVRLGLSP